ncbi:MAG: cytochrome c biogenesis protein CcdA, partial [Candidatus Altiarchaeota archaeon]
MDLGFMVALISGFFAGVSACAIPLYPAMLYQLTQNREDPRIAALFFTLGMAGVYFLIYLSFGVLAAFLGWGFVESAEKLRGYLTIFAALFSWFMAWRTLRGVSGGRAIQLVKAETKAGYSGALISGFVYGSVITTCNAPFLVTGILPALASRGSV